ncbi:hypothetical protein HAX54_046194 [Datura stramonium]|uniref:Uncharacterized protein n=1 Tax=Datura stramonium TaxID=4076 RepID=A0ABS8WIM9_DATST|nr:hypothetical protein [Datura stramonium]
MKPSLFLPGFELGFAASIPNQIGIEKSRRPACVARRASPCAASLAHRTAQGATLPICRAGHEVGAFSLSWRLDEDIFLQNNLSATK